MLYATPKFDIGKIHSTLHFPLYSQTVFKKQPASKVSIQLHDNLIRHLNILQKTIFFHQAKRTKTQGKYIFDSSLYSRKR